MEYRKWRMSRNMSVGQWLERTICELRNPVRLKPSSNWQVYVSLLHKLQAEATIIDMRIKDVGDATFRRLIRWMGNRPNFEGTMKVFSALLNRAHRSRLTRYKADFPYRNFQPKVQSAIASDILRSGGNVVSLTKGQWAAFLSLDMDSIRLCTGPCSVYQKELYRDFCILLYPFAPHIAEEIYEAQGFGGYLHNAKWTTRKRCC